ncbi:heme utilization protein HutZ [Aeromonas cavernicola]|uniref:Heme utilization protein HutZ n=1 Tax=Aeromonas cavernicola TaxID=1006623 RepID=A0A2H9U515_9GAMM|nr:heme utilization protein HutZ [Aeromonas cavernicola]PJG59117.1 heme utilization protein HutZ [Aeromonas cavernicola]
MSEYQERQSSRLQAEIDDFRDRCRTLQLATVDHAGCPNASYAPFVLLEDGYYVLISELARHGRNLQLVPKVSLMLIEDEGSARQLFARQRLTFDAQAHWVARDSERGAKAIEALEERFGEIVLGLAQLQDFVLYCLTPEQGLFVKGFGQAFCVSGDQLLGPVQLITGHQAIGPAPTKGATKRAPPDPATKH